MIKDLEENIKLHKSLTSQLNEIKKIGNTLYSCYLKSGVIYTCGNGGSNSDAQHFTAELMVKYKLVRKPIPSICLTLDTSTITACSNDFNYNKLFSRNLEALSNKNDILVVFSTSGNSPSIINSLKTAKRKGIITIGFLGRKKNSSQNLCDHTINIESGTVARIQECHIFIIHLLCNFLDSKIRLGSTKTP